MSDTTPTKYTYVVLSDGTLFFSLACIESWSAKVTENAPVCRPQILMRSLTVL